MTCRERENLIKNIPIIMAGSEKFSKCDTVKYIVPLMVYNSMPEVRKQIRFETLMKPLNKNGTPSGKFRELTTNQLKLCVEESERLISAIRYIEQAAEHEEAIIKRQREEAWRISSIEAQNAKKAPEISKETDVLSEFLKAFHVNSAPIDDDVATMVLLSFLGSREVSGDGLHIKLTAETGLGKSYSVNAALHALPQSAFYSGAFSDRALIYDKSIAPGMIIKLDEAQSKSETFESVVKEAVSSYQTGVTYRTVIDKETVVKQLPPRLTFIMLSADSWGDEQTVSRFVPLGLSDRNGKKKDLTKFRLKKRQEGVTKLHVNDIVLHSREILQHFVEREFRVKIPFVDSIEYETEDQRVQEWFECAVMYTAILHYKQRKPVTDEESGIITIEATKEDFNTCRSLGIFRSVKRIEHRFTQPELDIITALKKFQYEGKDITRSRLVEISKKSDSRVSQIMNGRDDRDKSGLKAKLGITEISISESEENTMDAKGEKILRYGHRTNEKAYKIPYLPDISMVNTGIDNTVARWV